jgi:two-component system sensor histidine kinase/response regulator
MDGVQALRLLRSNHSLRNVPIVALTAHAMKEEREVALREGFDDVIAKPCMPDELTAAISRLLVEGRTASV